MVTYLRDDFAHIPFPACWDLAGGGAEEGETPEGCALRETREEFGLNLAPDRIVWRRAYPSLSCEGGEDWFMVAHISTHEVNHIRFGDEGQHWRMMPVAEFCAHPEGITHLQQRLFEYLQNNES